jgi:hypothetical protein
MTIAQSRKDGVEVDIAPTKFGALELQQIKRAMKATANFAE